MCGSARGVWLWLREHGLAFPLRSATATPAWRTRSPRGGPDLPCGAQRAHPPRLRRRLRVRAHPPAERYVGDDGVLRTRRRTLAPSPTGRCSSPTIIPAFVTGTPTRPTRPASAPTPGPGGAPAGHRRGPGRSCPLLQGLASCGVCGRKLAVYYDGPRKTTPGYYCTGSGPLVDGRGARHLRVGGAGIDAAVAEAFLAALAPAALQACLAAAARLEDGHDTALAQWRREVERARYTASHR